MGMKVQQGVIYGQCSDLEDGSRYVNDNEAHYEHRRFRRLFARKSVDYDIARDNEEVFDIEMDANANEE